MQTSLERIAVKAQSNKSYRFRSLYGLLNHELLADSWIQLNRRAAAGADGISYKEYGDGVSGRIENLVNRLKEKKYHAKLVRRHYIPKDGGKLRPLGIPVIEDKLLQHAVTQLLNAIYEQDFLPCSFGYRLERGARESVKDLRKALQENNYNFVVEADIKGFFDNIEHEWMIKMLEQRIDDKSFTGLIRKWLKAGVLDTDGKVIHPLSGTPQGGVISPMLANIYMHYVLCLWFEKVVKKHCKGKAYLNVYADDFVCAFEYMGDAERFYRALGKRLKKFGLDLSPEKTKIIDFRKCTGESFDYPGFEFRMGRTHDRYIKVRTSRKKLQKSIKNFTLWCRENRHKKTGILFEELNTRLRGYYNYYGIKGNSESLYRFYQYVRKILFKWLNRRGQRQSYNWQGFKALVEHFNLLRPRISEA